MLRIVIDKRPGEKKYTVDIMDTRHGSKFDVRYYESYRQMVVDLVKAIDKWEGK